MALVVGTNSYVSVADAGTYYDDSLRNANWDALDSATQSAALIDATRMIDRLAWCGEKTSAAQALQFPRTGLFDINGTAVSSASVPQEVINATIELALVLGEDSTIYSSEEPGGSNIKRAQADTVSVEFFKQVDAGKLPYLIDQLIGHFYCGRAGNALSEGLQVGSYATGTDGTSIFTTGSEKFGKTRGWS